MRRVVAAFLALSICGSATAGANARPTRVPGAVYACPNASRSCTKLDRCTQHTSACTQFNGALECARDWNGARSPYRRLFPSPTLISSVYEVGKECLLLAWGQPKAGRYQAYVDRPGAGGWTYSRAVTTEANANEIATLRGYPPNVFFRAGRLYFTHGFQR